MTPWSDNPTDPDGRLTDANGDHAGPDGWYVDEDSVHTRRARLIAKVAPKHTYIVSTDLERILAHHMVRDNVQPRPTDIEFDNAREQLADVIDRQLDQTWANRRQRGEREA